MVPISNLVVASQLLIAVAADVPEFDIARGCKIDSTSAFDLNSGMNETIKKCVSDEQQAKGQLESQWAGFIAADRTMCTASTTNDRTIPPSYVDLLTCLQDQQLVRKGSK
jgi:hypothetical protein